jgi:hypothetical protein
VEVEARKSQESCDEGTCADLDFWSHVRNTRTAHGEGHGNIRGNRDYIPLSLEVLDIGRASLYSSAKEL